MKKLLVALSLMFVSVASATTVDLDWFVDGNTYAQTSCETGGNLILPSTPPTKYGYTFRGWRTEIINGTWTQNGTPSPTNPIDPVFYQKGNLILRAIGEGDNMVKDSFNPLTGKITRRVGVKVFYGTEDFITSNGMYGISFIQARTDQNGPSPVCTHFIGGTTIYIKTDKPVCLTGYFFVKGFIFKNVEDLWPTQEEFKQWLATQYANGTPVTVYYELTTPTEENFQ